MIDSESEFLDAVADQIETHGWTQGHYEWRGACCLMGGVRKVCVAETLHIPGLLHLGNPDWARFIDIKIRATVRITQAVGPYPVSWNDQPGRTKQQVLDKLRELAKAARQEEDAKA